VRDKPHDTWAEKPDPNPSPSPTPTPHLVQHRPQDLGRHDEAGGVRLDLNVPREQTHLGAFDVGDRGALGGGVRLGNATSGGWRVDDETD